MLKVTSAKRGTRSTGNVSKGSRPTNFAKGGRKGNMMVKPCPCVQKEVMIYGPNNYSCRSIYRP